MRAVTDFAKIGKYEVLEQAGKGSFGVVYKGRDPFLKREVAIKVCTVEDEEFRQRFFREAEIAGKLQHKNIVTVFAFGFDGGKPYLVQELLTGKDLRQLLEEHAALPLADKVDVLVQIAEGLAHAHAEGVIHRDVKPANVRRLEDGTVKILDFGIAKLAGAETRLTQTGVTLGTATYLSPEQVRGSDVDPRADQFSFGVLAYELLAGRRPFQGSTLSALVYQILYKSPVPLRQLWPDCPSPLATIVERCLEKEPERRYRRTDELTKALRAVYREIAGARRRSAAGEAPPAAGDDRGPETATRPMRWDPSRTQPIPILTLQSVGPPETEAAPPDPQIPAPGSPDLDKAEDLSSTAREIGELVAQGDLEAARRHLEATIELRSTVTAAEPPPAAESSSAEPPPRQPAGAAAEIAPRPAESSPAKAPSPRRWRAKSPKLPRLPELPNLPSLPAILAGLPPAARRGLLAAVALVAVLLIVWALPSKDEEPRAVPAPVAPPPPDIAAAAPEPVLHKVAIDALPWGRVTEIANLGDGSLVDLPELFHTPVTLELEAGAYRITVENPDYPETEPTFCELDVGPEPASVDESEPVTAGTGAEPEPGVEAASSDGAGAALADCTLTFRRATALDYFKETGWWQ